MWHSIGHRMGRNRARAIRGALVAALLMATVPAVIPVAAQRAVLAAGARHADLRFRVAFGGVGAEGVDDIWRGELLGRTPGEITLRVEYAGAPMDAARPVWPVRVMAFVAADDPAHSFLVESEGTLNWTTGLMHLSGRVSEGWMKGAAVDQTVSIDRRHLDGGGTLRLDLSVASR